MLLYVHPDSLEHEVRCFLWIIRENEILYYFNKQKSERISLFHPESRRTKLYNAMTRQKYPRNIHFPENISCKNEMTNNSVYLYI